MKKLEDALFPVHFKDLYTKEIFLQNDLNLFGKTEDVSTYVPLEHFQAVVAEDTGHVFAVVAPNYDLVTNEKAIALGKKCFQTIFQLQNVSDMEFYNLNMPETRSFCHIDYKHKGVEFMPFEEDKWFPFLRVTNSYNRMFALHFDLGFCRGICKNGVIFGKENIEFKFHHNKEQYNREYEFSLRAGDFLNLEKEFVEKLANIQRYHVPRRFMFPLFCKVFNVSPLGEKPTKKQIDAWIEKQVFIREKTTEYFDKLGENGYAALNVLTDYATRPVGVISAEAFFDNLQRKAGSWIAEFIKEIEKRDFRFEAYLGEYAHLVA